MLRLGCSLSLLGAPGIEKTLPSAGALRARADALLRAAGALRATLPMARDVRAAVTRAGAASTTVRSQKSLDAAKTLVRPLSDGVRNRLDDARRLGGEVPDPFARIERAAEYATANAAANLGESLVGASPAWRELDEIFAAGELFVGRWTDLYRRVLGELVEIAETIERTLASASRAPEPSAPAIR